MNKKEDVKFLNDEEHVINMAGTLSNLSAIKSISFEDNKGYLHGGRRRNEGSRCWIELENGYEVSYFSEAGFGQAREHAEMECLLWLSKIDKYLEYVKTN